MYGFIMIQMKRAVRYIPMVVGFGLVMSLLVLYLFRWSGYVLSWTVLVPLVCIVLACVWAMQGLKKYRFNVSVIQIGSCLVGIVIVLAYSFAVSSGISGNTLQFRCAVMSLIVFGPGIVLACIQKGRDKR